jgi:hypothetical protein
LTDPTSSQFVANDEGKELPKHNAARFDYELYNQDDDVSMAVIRVKRIALPNDGERWKLFEGSKIIQVIEGNKLTKKERIFLQSIDGVNFLLDLAKGGERPFNMIKAELKKKLAKKD